MAIVQAPPATLANALPGEYQCESVWATGQNAIRLKRLGICEGRWIEIVGRGDPMILRIGDSRIGLSRQLASFVTVHENASSPLADD